MDLPKQLLYDDMVSELFGGRPGTTLKPRATRS